MCAYMPRAFPISGNQNTQYIMKTFLRKTWLIALMLVLGASTAWAEDVTFSLGTTSGKDVSSSSGTTKSNITVSFSNGSGTALSWQTDHVRFYHNGSKVTVSSTSANITGIVINAKSGYASADLKVGTTSLTSNETKTEYKYTPSSAIQTVSITNDGSAQARLTSIVVTTSSGDGGGTPTTYSVNIDKNIANGTVTASPTTAASGATITLTATPATGYEFGSWSVTNASTSAAISVANNKFTMPAADVNVSATFNQIQGGGEAGGDGTTVTWIASEQGYTNGVQYTSATVDSNISLAFGDGGNDGKYYDTDTGIRLYANGKLTVSAANGGTISKIVITYSSTSYTGTFSASTGEYKLSSTTGTWTGSAGSVVLTNTATSGHARIQKIAVTYTAGDEGGGSASGDPQISNFIKTSTLNLDANADPYDVRQCLNIPADYEQSAYAITTTIDGLTQKDGEFACVYPYLAFQKAGTYTVTVTAAAVPGKYAETKGAITVTVTGGTSPEPETTVYDNLAALVAAGTPTTDGRNVTVTLTDEIITGIYTATGGYRNGIFLQVGEQEIEVYCKNVPETWEVGGTVTGTLYKCPWKLYNTTWELCPESWGLLYYTAPALQELSITGEPKNEYYVGDSFDVAGLTVTAKYTSGTTLNVTDQVEWAYEPETFTQEGSAIQVTVMAGLGETIAEKTYTVSVAKNPYVIAGNFTAIKGNIDENISYEAFKGNAANDPIIPKDTGYIRLYQNGGYITISGAKGVTISEVVLTTGSTYETTTIGYAVGDDDVPTTGSTVAKNSDFKVSDLSCNSISFYCLGTDSKSRIDIAAIKVKYTKVDINLASISVAGEGVGKEFLQNSTFNHDGINVTAKYSDNSKEDVTVSAEFTAPDMTTVGEKTVEVSYTEGGVTKTTSYTINVVAESITELHIATLPTKTVFKLGESFSSEGLSVTADYNSGRKNVELEATDYEVVAPSTESLGKQEVIVRLVANKEIAESYTVSIVPTNTIFFESFDTNDGTGGNDNQWNGSIASNNIKSDNVDVKGKSTWTFTAAGGANQCAKFGTGSAAGSAVTPVLDHIGSVTVSFKAAAWNGNNEKTTIKVSIADNVASAQDITLTKGAWNDYSVTLTGLTAESKVKFAASEKDNNRFFLDEVLITTAAEPAVGRVTNYIEALKNGEEGYTLDGLQKIINDILQIKQ